MGLTELEKIRINHKDHGKQILEYANTHLGVGLRYTNVNKLVIDLGAQKRAEIRVQKNWKQGKKKIVPPFFKKVEKMLEQYQEEKIIIRDLKKKEKEAVLPLNPTLEKLARDAKPVIRPWHNNKYKCSSLKEFVEEYINTAKTKPTPELVLDYIVKENGEPYKYGSIRNTINS